MKTLTSFQFAHTIVTHNRGQEVYIIEASRIFHLSEMLIDEHIICRLGGGAFLDLEEAYPGIVEVKGNEVVFKQLPQLEEQLKRRLRFSQDDELEERVWERWERMQ